MNGRTPQHGRIVSVGLAMLTSLLVCVPLGASAASSYLQELEAEAARSEEGSDAAPAQQGQEWNTNAQPVSGEAIKAGLDKAQFEESLKKNYYGSYLFYQTLDDGDQQSVYSDYQSDNDIESIRESIKSHMKN